MSDKENDNKGNDTLESVEEKVTVGEDVITLKITGKGEDAKYEAEAPEGKEDDPEFAKIVDEAVSIYAKANLKGFKTNQAQEKLDQDKLAFEQEKADWKIKKTLSGESGQSKIPSKKELVMKHLKITDPDDLEDVSRADYLEAEGKAETEINQARTKITDTSDLVTNFIAGGGDYNELINLSQTLNAPISKALINQLSKTKETKKPKFATAELARIQRKQIHIVKKGTLQAKHNEGNHRANAILNAKKGTVRL